MNWGKSRMIKMKKMTRVVSSIGLIILFLSSSPPRAAATETQCKINFTMKSWSFFYKSGKGKGTIACDNGQSAKVILRAHSGGLTFGKSRTLAGRGVFSRTADIRDVFGSYALAEAHGGAGNSGSSQVLTKGEISLALTGTGKGVNIGLDIGSFKITRVR